MNLTYTPPPRTTMEVFESLPEGTLCQVINNTLYMSPAPNLKHQKFQSNLFYVLSDLIIRNNLGLLFAPVTDVYLDDENVFQPDLIFISNDNMSIIVDDKIKGSPNLLIEILSPSNEKMDTEIKKEMYQQFGVKEYWIANPDDKRIIVYHLSENKYIEYSNQIGKANSKLLNKEFVL